MLKVLNRIVIPVALIAAAIAPASALAADYVYWGRNTNPSTSSAIARANPDGTGINTSVVPVGSIIGGIAFNATHVFWASMDGVYRAPIDGAGTPQHLFSAGIAPGVAIDGQHFYAATMSGPSAIVRGNLDGSGSNASFMTGVGNPTMIAVDATHIYWTDQGNDSIGRANLDGTGINTTFITGATDAYGIAVTGSHIYWTSGAGGTTIGRANLDGTGANTSFLTGQAGPQAIAVDSTHLYWYNKNSGDISRSLLDGTSVNASFIAGAAAATQSVYGIAAAPGGSAPPPSYALTVTKSGTGSGAVTSAPAGVDCGATCTANFTSGTSVTLTSAPAAGSTFAGWSGACTGATKTCTVSVTAATAVTARFVPAAASTADPFRVKGGKIRTRVSVTGAGRVVITGTVGRARRTAVVCTVKRTFKQRASAWMVCQPSKATQARRATGPVPIVLTMTFTPTGGKAKTSRVGTVVLPRIEPTPSVVTG